MTIVALITDFYSSKVRQRRWGTICDQCHKLLEIGTEIMRAQTGKNDFGCMTYDILCLKCYKRILPREIKKAEKHVQNYAKEHFNEIKKLRKTTSTFNRRAVGK